MRREYDTRGAWVAAWLIIAGGVAVGFLLRAFQEEQARREVVPVNESQVGELDPEPTLSLVEEGQ